MTEPIAATHGPESEKSPGPALWISIAVFLIGAALIAAGTFMIMNRVLESATVESFPVPGQQTRELDAGMHDIFASTGGLADFSTNPSFSASDVTIANTNSGEIISVSPSGAVDVSINRQTTRYERVGVFTIPESGSYTFDVNPLDGAESRAVVAASLEDSFDELVTPLILVGIGTIVTLLGVILIVVGIVRRGRAQRKKRGFGQSPGVYTAPPPTAAPTTQPQPGATPQPGAPPPPPNNTRGSETNTPW